MPTDTRSAAAGLAMTVLAALAAVVTGDLAVTLISIGAGLARLAWAYRHRPRSPHLYRARFAIVAWLA